MVSEPEKIEEFDNLDDDEPQGEPVKEPGTLDGVEEIELTDEVEEVETLEEVSEGGEEETSGRVDQAPEMMFSRREQEQAQEREEVLVKYCLFCRELIPVEAIACKHCGHVVHIFEGNVFKQLYFFLWGAVITLVGTMLPYYSGGEAGTLVTGCTTFVGSLFLVFSLLLLFAMCFSIYSKRLIMSPVFLMFIPAVVTWWALVKSAQRAPADMAFYKFFYNVDAINWLAKDVGSGLLLVMLGSTMTVLTFIVSLFTAIFGGGKDKEKGARAGSKGRGRKR